MGMGEKSSSFTLGDPNVGWDAARAIGQVGIVDNVLTKHNHAIIKVMLYEICVGC